jgi:polysaccharide biosynthesis protein PelG
MAGIGFDLRRLCLEEQTFFGKVRAYATAGVVAAGPWLITMASLWLVRLLSRQLPTAEVEQFLSIASTVFAASLITMGGLQMAATRWLADTLFGSRFGALVPAFARLFTIVAAIQATAAVATCFVFGVDLALITPVTLLYTSVSLSWLAFVWLSLVRQHDRILVTFGAGGVVFAAALLLLGDRLDLRTLLWLYALTNCLVVAVMAVLVLRGTEAADESGDVRLRGLFQHRTLWWVGTIYALSLWADKLVFWWCDGIRGDGLVPHHPLYDSCFYLAYMTVVPALTVNLVHLETEFYEHYRAYYGAVEGHGTLGYLRDRGADLRHSLEQAAGKLLRIQGAVTFAACWFAPELAALAGLPPFAGHTLRLACVGAFCHVLLLLTILVLLYFDRTRAALRASLLFLVANALLAGWSISAGPVTYGLGYAVAGLLALVWALAELRHTLANLEYLTFVRS